jgi:hypothetical protein
MDAFKFPVSFSTDTREIVKLREGSDDYIKQIISICILTEPFTLPLTPDFGTADPSFSVVSPEQLMLAANKFIPEVSIVAVNSSISDDSGSVNVQFIYNR